MEDSKLDIFTDEYFMKEALKLARRAAEEGEVPIGAVVVSGTRVIGRGYNQVEKLQDGTPHAEMIAITAASDHLGSKYLSDCTLYVTIEPCVMCAGALRWVQIPRIVYGSDEPKFGYSRVSPPLLHPSAEIKRGVLAEECAGVMQDFFKARRNKQQTEE